MSSSSTAGIGTDQAEYSAEILSVNGEQIKVDKYLLAYNSRRFDDIFFGKDCKSEESKIIKLEPPATPEHFQRMLDTLEHQDRPLDDQCLEAVYQLAKQFLVRDVEGKCQKFLAKESKHSAIFKYRLADKYGLDDLKQQILDSSKWEYFFKEADFVENLEEFAKLEVPAREALATRLRRLFDPINLQLRHLPAPQESMMYLFYRGMIAFRNRLEEEEHFGRMSEHWGHMTRMRMDEFASRPGAAVLFVNEKEVRVNKYYLARKSHFFERFFFGEGYKENNKLELEFPATVEHFERMLDTLEPWNRPLDDECIEPVLHLANQLLMREVEEKCLNFLAEKSNRSKRSAIFKYRLVDKYGSDQLKEQILGSSTKWDFFKEEEFLENLEEFAKLDVKAREALATRLRQLFASP